MSSSTSSSGSGSISSSRSVSGSRTLIFRILTIAGGGLMLVSWFMPWWQAWIVALRELAVVIHPWGLESFMPQEYAAWLTGADMPDFFAPLMWLYLVLCMAALVFSLFASDKIRLGLGKFKLPLPQWLVVGVGVSFIVFVVVCAYVISLRAPEFYDAPLQGTVHVAFSDHEVSDVITSFQPGYLLACAVGPLLTVLGLLRGLIVGKPKLGT